jgi:hypothetical protein
VIHYLSNIVNKKSKTGTNTPLYRIDLLSHDKEIETQHTIQHDYKRNSKKRNKKTNSIASLNLLFHNVSRKPLHRAR